jgi:flagellar hook-basal body complex protein FliE
MSPLSSINLLPSPELRTELLARASEGLSGKPIASAELAKLTPTSDIQPSMLTATSGDTFSNLLGNMVQDVNAKQAAASESVNGLLSGQNVSLHQTMIAMEEASVSFQLMVEVRNRLLDSYQELMRMQI